MTEVQQPDIDSSAPDERELDVLYVRPERFRASPQVGVPCRMTWRELALYLSRPSVGEAKDEAGAWSPALYQNNIRRKSALVSIRALVVDVDEGGLVEDVAGVLGRYRAIVHETFSSTNAAPRCRIVLDLAEPINAVSYEHAHKVVRTHLSAVGIVADEGAKDASRLSYSPVRRAGAGYRFATMDGKPLDVGRLLTAHPPDPVSRRTAVPRSEHRDAYVRAALRMGAKAIARAPEGVRHYTLSREAWALARLGLGDDEIVRALLPAFVSAAGARREHEGVRTIRDAIRARRGAA